MQVMEMIRAVAGLIAGGLIGLGFGWMQGVALAHNRKRQQSGQLNSAWAVMPGSLRRVALLLVVLALVQVLCPLLFVHGSQWWVSAGVVGGYGGFLLRRLRQQSSRRTP
jgi:hypothetical protein